MAKFEIVRTTQFKKDLKLAIKRGLDIDDLLQVVGNLSADQPLPKKNRNHLLSGEYKGFWECHINPDWLLIYSKDKEIRIITLKRTGTHSDLFGK